MPKITYETRGKYSTSDIEYSRYRNLCAEIHRKFGRKLGLPYWESCSLADEICFGETTKKKLFANLTEATEENE
tara:strand:+ start:325 stop:546 length:222 start_codon:yes stop_codon:yes gene_type:complete